jgi:HEPN domain-containing protein
MPHEELEPVARAWYRKAVGDLEAARVCFESASVPGWIVGFHLQQAVEKALKGMLVVARCEPPRTHDLVRLHQLLIQHGGQHPLAPEDIEALQPFAVEDRYPILLPTDVSRDELRALLRAAEVVLAALRAQLAIVPDC